MSKQGQHKNDAFDQSKSPGNNHKDRSQTITTGTPKKKETYDEQARQHKDTSPLAQAAKNDWSGERLDRPRNETRGVRARASDIGTGRSGSDSNG